MIKVGIIGGSGYTGGELIRLLVNHPAVEINFVYSTTRAGLPIRVVLPRPYNWPCYPLRKKDS